MMIFTKMRVDRAYIPQTSTIAPDPSTQSIQQASQDSAVNDSKAMRVRVDAKRATGDEVQPSNLIYVHICK